MMIKVNGEYLEFNGEIEIEKKIKLFEEIESTDGDFSFAFDLEMTSNNIRVMNKPFPDASSKTVYLINDAEILSDEGMLINRGYIRVERIFGRIASCSFFGGNNNWFAALSGNMTDLNLSRYDVSLTPANIISSWTATDGIIFPLIDTGALITRGAITSMSEDYAGCFYAHTLLKEVFQQSGIKITGELLEDPFFLSLVIAANGRTEEEINNRSSYVEKTSDQTATGSVQIITFDNDSVLPFFDGATGNFDLPNNRYVADIKMTLSINYTFNTDNAIGFLIIYVYKNGVEEDVIGISASAGTKTHTTIVDLEAGDYVDFRFEEFTLSSGEIISGTVTFTPIFLYESYGTSSVPDWTKQEFVSNILGLFNTVCAYDSFTKTLTINLVEKIKEKDPIDISAFISETEIDYSDFISSYGQSTTLSYQDGNDVDLIDFNITEFLKSVTGSIEVNNDFIEKEAEALETDFASPVSYKHPVFGNSIERINFVELEETEDGDISSVSDNGGIPRFNISNADQKYIDGGLVRIVSNVSEYNGDFVIANVTSSYIEVSGLDYISDATGEATMLRHSITQDDNVYLFSVMRNVAVDDAMDYATFFVDSTLVTEISIAFFNLMRLGHAVEARYTQGLSFAEINNPFFFQRTLTSRYWSQFGRILNDPVSLLSVGNLPWKVYNDIDFLRPITIRSLETSNQYYVNRITGYKSSAKPCQIQLIKLP
jgi:hypothetical protein